MPNLPTGTVTFLFTDIEGSTRLWEQYSVAMKDALQRHDRLLRDAVEARGGYVFKTVGDAFCAAFPTAVDALSATISAHRALQAEKWGETGPLKIKAGLHTGIAQERDADYFGPTLNRVARLQAAGHGGQTLLSLPTYELVRDHLPAGAQLIDLGEHLLKDLIRPERIFQLITPDLPSQFPSLKTLHTHPNNLPVQLTPLIGREKEVSAISLMLRHPDAHIVTLTGPGGTGKTRLSLQVAADMLDDFADGVWFVDLAPIVETSLVISTIAQCLGVKEAGGTPIFDTLKAYLKEKHLLLLLDNFEQVVDAAPQVAQLLSVCPTLKVIVTSRVPLKIRGEHEYSVPPLQLPDPHQLPPIERLTQYESVRLFIERAEAVQADFQLTGDNAPAVAEICVRLDGLPLAIELAAARVRLLPPRAMLSRLQNRLKLLTGGGRDLAARQQTLRKAIDWSYDLLDKGEKQLFNRLAVFVGGRTLEAIEAVCNAKGDLQVDVLDGIESLMSKSLLRQEEGVGGEPRFVMLETIHEYAREKLAESGEEERVKRSHTAYFLALAERMEPKLKGVGQEEAVMCLEAEHDNVRTVLDMALQRGEAATAARLAGALWRFWLSHGYLSEGRWWLDRATAPGSVMPGSARAKALHGMGVLTANQGDYARARELIEEAVALYREMRDAQSVADALNSLGLIACHQDDPQAQAFFEESLGLQRALGNSHGTAAVLYNLGMMAEDQGDYVGAEPFYEESLALARKMGDKEGAAWALNGLGQVAFDREEFEQALGCYQESLVLCRDIGDKMGIALGLERLAGVVASQGAPERAARLFGAAEALREKMGSHLEPSYRGTYERTVESARRQLDPEVWRAAWQMGHDMSLAESLVYASEPAQEATMPW